MAAATLLVIQGIDQGTRFQLNADVVGIGRGIHNQIRILDTEVSRQHARIVFRKGQYILEDRGSSNGTLVNGQPVRQYVLKNTDQVQVGRTVLLFSHLPQSSPVVAEQLNLVSIHEDEDQSSIVGTAGQDSSRTLLGGELLQENEEVRREYLENLRALYRVTEEAVTPSTSSEELLTRILQLTIDAVKADRGCILLDNPETGKMIPTVFANRITPDQAVRMPISRSIVDYVVKQGQGVRTTDARSDQRFGEGQSILQANVHEAMCVPLQGRYQLMGMIYVDTRLPSEQALLAEQPRHHFTEDQLRLLVAIGRQAALALENNRYQQALVKAERLAAMGQTIAMLSHHIKNILQGIRGGSYLMDLGLKDHKEEMIRKGWGIVEKNQERIFHLVTDMLSFSKERKPELQDNQLNETVGDVCELIEARAADSGVSLNFKPGADLPYTLYDAEAIHRAVLNVVINAIDAVEGKEGAEVRVRCGYSKDSDVFYVTVADNGPGIPEEQLEKIFNVFESSKGARGTGLGLAVSQKILREHGGEITVKTKVGQGSQFVLSWSPIESDHTNFELPTLPG